MAVLPNPRHELYAQGVAKGQSQREAYLAAGYETGTDAATDVNASRLLSDARVSGRVQELQEIAAEAAGMTRERVLVEMGVIGFAPVGHEFVKVSDKRAALSDIGKAIGMFSERVEITGKDGKDLIPEANETEVARRVAFLLAQGLAKQN